MRAVAFGVALAMGCLVGQANAYTGNELLKDCTEATPTFDKGFCTGFIWGIAYAQTGVCPKAKVTAIQMRDIVIKYLRENPATRHGDAYILTWEALEKAFPCGQSKPG